MKLTAQQKTKLAAGTPFQQKVWIAMTHIKKGKVMTYKQIAELIGHPTAYRAVAGACGANPCAPEVPCHRVVGSNGLGGYSGKGGLATKRRLLMSEGVDVDRLKDYLSA